MALPTLVIGDVYAVRYYCKDSEQTSVNTVYMLVTNTTLASVTLQELADRMDAVLGTGFIALIAATATYQGVGVKLANLPNPHAEVFSTISAGVGTAGAVGLPRQTAGLLSFYDGLSGPKHRGRLYLPFPAAADNDLAGTPKAGYVAQLATIATVLQGSTLVNGAAGTASLRHVIFHRATLTHDNVESYVARNVWATMKKRGSEGRANKGPLG